METYNDITQEAGDGAYVGLHEWVEWFHVHFFRKEHVIREILNDFRNQHETASCVLRGSFKIDLFRRANSWGNESESFECSYRNILDLSGKLTVET